MDALPIVPGSPAADNASLAPDRASAWPGGATRVDTDTGLSRAPGAAGPGEPKAVARDAVALPERTEVALSMAPRAPEITENGGCAHPAAGFAEPVREPGPKAPAAGAGGGSRDPLAAAADALAGIPLASVERLVIEANIRASGGSLPKAARVLGVSPSTLYRKRAGWVD